MLQRLLERVSTLSPEPAHVERDAVDWSETEQRHARHLQRLTVQQETSERDLQQWRTRTRDLQEENHILRLHLSRRKSSVAESVQDATNKLNATFKSLKNAHKWKPEKKFKRTEKAWKRSRKDNSTTNLPNLLTNLISLIDDMKAFAEVVTRKQYMRSLAAVDICTKADHGASKLRCVSALDPERGPEEAATTSPDGSISLCEVPSMNVMKAEIKDGAAEVSIEASKNDGKKVPPVLLTFGNTEQQPDSSSNKTKGSTYVDKAATRGQCQGEGRSKVRESRVRLHKKASDLSCQKLTLQALSSMSDSKARAAVSSDDVNRQRPPRTAHGLVAPSVHAHSTDDSTRGCIRNSGEQLYVYADLQRDLQRRLAVFKEERNDLKEQADFNRALLDQQLGQADMLKLDIAEINLTCSEIIDIDDV